MGKDVKKPFDAKADLDRLNRASAEYRYFMNWASDKFKPEDEFVSGKEKIALFKKHLKENNLDETGNPLPETQQFDID